MIAREPSRDVERLKELLFDRESQELGDLARQIETVARVDHEAREELRTAISQVFDRAGTDERLAVSVSQIIAPALRRAEVKDHIELSNSIAPLVVSTIKTELRNSQDEMVEALYPITGRLVKSYVASAIRDLSTQMNRRLEQNALMLRLQSLTTGKSVAELALAGAAPFDVTELYLIRRASGELVARWPQSDTSVRDQALGGVLAAINEFANDAFSAKEGSMRQIDLGSEIVYLRGSPLFLLAARCTGAAAPGLEQAIDDVFLDAIEKQADAVDQRQTFDILKTAGTTLKARVDEAQTSIANEPRGNGLLKALAALIILPLLGWFGFQWYSSFMDDRVRVRAAQIISAEPEMAGYPTNLVATSRGRILEIKGLAPTDAVHQRVMTNLARSLPGTTLIDQFSALPEAGPGAPDLSPEVSALKNALTDYKALSQREQRTTALELAIANVTAGLSDLRAAAEAAKDEPVRVGFTSAADNTEKLLMELRQSRDALLAGDADSNAAALVTSLLARIKDLQPIFQSLGGDTSASSNVDVPLEQSEKSGALQSMAILSGRFSQLASNSLLATKLAVPPPKPAVVKEVVVKETVTAAPPPSPRIVLEHTARAKAVFFANGTDYRDEASAKGALDAVADAMKSANIMVRIIGYTDDAGTNSINTPLALQRAERVRSELLSRGVAPGLLAIVGRADRIDISAVEGPTSPNRRVEFEVGFDGEAQP
jgi:outer membrane protein OmpA-like peptidoglycan-associated protein